MEKRKENRNGTSIQIKKKKPPQVRQTLTSKLRMLKANPLLMHELGKKITDDCTENGNRIVMRPLKQLVAVLDNETKGKSELKNTSGSRKLSFTAEHLHRKNSVSSNEFTNNRSSVQDPRSSLKLKHNICSQNTGEINKLSEWLKRHGKNISEYQYLKCFGVDPKKQQNDDDKENVENNLDEQNNENINVDVSDIAQEALKDLHKLILDGYSSEHCEIWLKLIKEKCRQVENEPQYWECRAGLEQTKGNIQLAVECYKSAIVHGAEVESVDKHLDQLLKKFNILNIKDPSVTLNHEASKIVQDARNIFKSSIIQFAVQERSFRKKSEMALSVEKKFIATPVRRSTRLSRSRFTSTPGIQLYSSLQEVDNSMKDVLHFQCNNALKD